MTPIWIRILALVLVPCLLADPALADVFSLASFPARQRTPLNLFKEQALIATLVGGQRYSLKVKLDHTLIGAKIAEKLGVGAQHFSSAQGFKKVDAMWLTLGALYALGGGGVFIANALQATSVSWRAQTVWALVAAIGSVIFIGHLLRMRRQKDLQTEQMNEFVGSLSYEPVAAAEEDLTEEPHPDNAQIESYLRNEMTADQRREFVERLRSDPKLRLATIQQRAYLEADEIPTSAKASDLFNKAFHQFIEGNMVFPGDPYISGMENRPDIGPERRRKYQKAIQYLEQLIILGEMEDLAFENISRLNHNLISGEAAAKRYPGYSELGSVEGMLSAVMGGAGDRESVEGRMQPVSAPRSIVQAHVSVADRLASSTGSQSARKIVLNLWEIVPEDWYYAPHKMKEPLLQEERLLTRIQEDPGFLQELNRFVQEEVRTADASKETRARFAAARLLVAHYRKTGDMAVLSPVIGRLQSLLRLNRDRSLVETSDRLLKGLFVLLVIQSDQDDAVWNMVRPILFKEWDAKIYGIQNKDRRKGRFMRDLYEDYFLKEIDVMERRLKTDDVLIKKIQKLAGRKDAAHGVAWLLRSMSPEHSYSLAWRVLPGTNYDSQRWVGWAVGALPAEFLTTQTDAAEKAQALLHKNPRNADMTVPALEMLLKIDPEQFDTTFTAYVGGDEAIGGFYQVVRFALEQNLRRHKQAFITYVLKHGMRGNDLSDSPRRLVVELFEEWKIPSEEIVQVAIARPPEPVDEHYIYFLASFKSVSAVPVIAQALNSPDSRTRFAAARTLGADYAAEHITRPILLKLIRVAEDETMVNMGLWGEKSIADQAIETLSRLGQHVQFGTAIQDTLDLRLLQAMEESNPLSDSTRERLYELRDSLKGKKGQLSGPDAYMQFIASMDVIPEVWDVFLKSLLHEAPYSEEEMFTHAYIGQLIGDEPTFVSMASYLAAHVRQDPRLAKKLTGMQRLMTSQQDQSPVAIMRRIALLSVGVTSRVMDRSYTVFPALEKAFLEQYEALKRQTFVFRSDLDIVFIAAALMRVRQPEEALAFLGRHPVEGDTQLGSVAFYSELAAEEASQEGLYDMAIRLYQATAAVVQGIPALQTYSEDIQERINSLKLLKQEQDAFLEELVKHRPATSPLEDRVIHPIPFRNTHTIQRAQAWAQKEISQGKIFPVQGTLGREKLWNDMGIQLGTRTDEDSLFRHVQLPAGWKVRPDPQDELQMFSDLIDPEGSVRARIFYKEAEYDRHAYISLSKEINAKTAARMKQSSTQREGLDSEKGSKLVETVLLTLGSLWLTHGIGMGFYQGRLGWIPFISSIVILAGALIRAPQRAHVRRFATSA
jgi:hypothetical protein